MSGNPLRNAGQLLKFADRPADDRHLLGRVAGGTDEAAFAELVRRHGPMVLGVCRRVLRHEQDAEDAFQAAFLVLARKAAAVRDGRSLGSWLFGVARHIALRLRDKDRRRHRHEYRAVAAAPPAGPDNRGGPEALAVLDEEVQRLPERYRVPIVACHLQGRTQEEAAEEMGWSVRTLRRRLDRGRELLKARLVRRGVTPPAGLVGAGGAATVVPDALADATRRAAVVFAHGGEVAPPVAALVKGALTMTTLTKLKVLIGTVLALGGAAALWPAASAALPGPADPPVGQRAADPPVGSPPTAPKAPPVEKGGTKPKDGPPEKEVKTPGTEDRIRPGDHLRIHATNVLEGEPVDGIYVVEPGGKIALAPIYGGRVRVDGLTVEEAEAAILAQIKQYVKNPTVMVRRRHPVLDGSDPALERRVRQLEQEVRDLRAVVDGLRKKQP